MEPSFSEVQTARIQIIAIVMSGLFIALVIELIRRGRLREEYSLAWLAVAVVFIYFSIFRSHMDAIAHRLGFAYGPALLIMLIILFGSVMLIHFSIVVSRLTTENKRLAQEMAILESELRRLGGEPRERES